MISINCLPKPPGGNIGRLCLHQPAPEMEQRPQVKMWFRLGGSQLNSTTVTIFGQVELTGEAGRHRQVEHVVVHAGLKVYRCQETGHSVL